MKINTLFLVLAVVGTVSFFSASCEDKDGNINLESKVECKIDGVDWSATNVMFSEKDMIFSVQGINGKDTLAFDYDLTFGHVIGAKYGNYSMFYAGLIENQVNSESEASGNFEFTLYDNYLMPTDSIVITNGDFLVLK